MCARIKIKGRVINLYNGDKIPRESMLVKRDKITPAKKDAKLSSHKFIRAERVKGKNGKIIADWSKPVELTPVQIMAESFCEQEKWFDLPEQHSLAAFWHKQIDKDGYALSICTKEATGEVAEVHHRMPIIERTWNNG